MFAFIYTEQLHQLLLNAIPISKHTNKRFSIIDDLGNASSFIITSMKTTR
jgi:hypothetical protein